MPILGRNFLYRDMKCGRICHAAQLPVLHRRKGSQHFMNQAKFHSTFPILLLIKSHPPSINRAVKIKDFSNNKIGNVG